MNFENINEIFKFTKKKFFVGCILALIVFCICCIKYSVLAGVILACPFIVLGAFELKKSENI